LDPELDFIDGVGVEARNEFKEIPERDEREKELEEHGVGDEIGESVLEDII
jgi:hypothetical protein